MSLLLLDTTVLIDAERDAAALNGVIGDDTAIAAVTVAELQVGASLADGERRTARQAFIAAVVAVVPVISYGPPVGAMLRVAQRKQLAIRSSAGAVAQSGVVPEQAIGTGRIALGLLSLGRMSTGPTAR